MHTLKEWRQLREFGEEMAEPRISHEETDQADSIEGRYDVALSGQLKIYLNRLLSLIQKNAPKFTNAKRAFIAQEVLLALGFTPSKLSAAITNIKQTNKQRQSAAANAVAPGV